MNETFIQKQCQYKNRPQRNDKISRCPSPSFLLTVLTFSCVLPPITYKVSSVQVFLMKYNFKLSSQCSFWPCQYQYSGLQGWMHLLLSGATAGTKAIRSSRYSFLLTWWRMFFRVENILRVFRLNLTFVAICNSTQLCINYDRSSI